MGRGHALSALAAASSFFLLFAGAALAQATDAPPPPPEITIVGHTKPPSVGASDIRVRVGALARVPRKNATELLTLAPGFLLTKEGGDGHAEQIFLRGFDAREGQDLELTVGGVPVNESGNLRGNGHADTHFIIPELASTARVVEGPFDPRQGNYAVAGSADYELGLERRGLTARYTFGSFNSHRLLLLWSPPGGSAHTFEGVEHDAAAAGPVTPWPDSPSRSRRGGDTR